VIRFLLVGNGVVLGVVAVLYLLYGARPGGLVVGGVLATGSLSLLACVPLTDPYRRRRRR
jgi:hypothetical protein